MKSLSLKLPDEMEAKLAAEARRTKTSKSALVRKAIDGFLSGQAPRSALSCLDLAGDLVGSIDGPEDLSVNKRYLSGYGQ